MQMCLSYKCGPNLVQSVFVKWKVTACLIPDWNEAVYGIILIVTLSIESKLLIVVIESAWPYLQGLNHIFNSHCMGETGGSANLKKRCYFCYILMNLPPWAIPKTKKINSGSKISKYWCILCAVPVKWEPVGKHHLWISVTRLNGTHLEPLFMGCYL